MDKNLYWLYSIALVLYYVYKWYRSSQKKQQEVPVETTQKQMRPPVAPRTSVKKSATNTFEKISTKNVVVREAPEYEVLSYENPNIPAQIQDTDYHLYNTQKSFFKGNQDNIAGKPKKIHSILAYLKTVNGAKNAFIYSEIFNRKF